MDENFEYLLPRVLDTLEKSDLVRIEEQLKSIKGNTIVVGVGGSRVVADYAGKALSTDAIVSLKGPRDLLYEDISLYENILIASYSGKGYVIESLKNLKQKKFLLTNGDVSHNGFEIIKYDNSIKKEHSYISLASTLMPMSILLSSFSKMNIDQLRKEIENMFNTKMPNINKNDIYEIIYGVESSTSVSYLESTFVESSIAVPILHEKYSFCHGRTATSFHNDNGLIYFDGGKELDDIILAEANKYFNETVKIKKMYSDDDYKQLLNNFCQTIQSMYLTKNLANNKNMSLSKVEYSPFVKELYTFKGTM